MKKILVRKIILFLIFYGSSIGIYFLLGIAASKIGSYATVFHYYIELGRLTCLIFPLFAGIVFFIPLKKAENFYNFFQQIRTRRFLFFLGMGAFILLSFIAYFVFEGVPKGDAVNVFFQTKIFSHGKLYAPAPDHAEFFHTASTIRHTGKWFSMLPPGHALALLPFYLLKLSWLTGPLLGVLSLIVVYLFCRTYFDETTARLAGILALFSPYFLLMQASFLPHASGLFFTLLLLYLFLQADSNQKAGYFLFAGGAAGMLLLIRPYTCVAIVFPFVIYSLVQLIKKRMMFKKLVWILPGIVAGAGITFWYNSILTGDFLTFPYDLHRMAGYNRIGFGAAVGTETFGLRGHSPIKAIINLAYNFFVTSMHLHGTPFLSFIPAFIFLLKGNKRREDFLLIAMIVSLVLFHFFYWFHGVNPMGSRYYFEVIFALLILNARGIMFLSKKFVVVRHIGDNNSSYFSREFIAKILLLVIVFNVVVYLPQSFTFFKKSGWGETREIYDQVKQSDTKTLVFIKPPRVTTPKTKNLNMFMYGSGFNYNDPWLEGQHLFVRWLGEDQNRELLKYFVDRMPVVVTFDEVRDEYVLRSLR